MYDKRGCSEGRLMAFRSSAFGHEWALFPNPRWPAFSFERRDYDLGHLDEFTFGVRDSRGVERQIAVTFSDHCFTRKATVGDDPALYYPQRDRSPGCFCFDRYHHSFDLKMHITWAAGGKVWTVQGDSFAIIPTLRHDGQPVLYGIVFSLQRVKGLPIDLWMRVKTAFPYTESLPETYGSTRFAHLVSLIMSGKNGPGRITDQNRRRPQLDV